KYNFYIKSTIENFKNSGLIESKGYAVTFQEGSTINNFNNTGTIITKENNGRDAVWINKTTIQTFSNTGTIESSQRYGIYLSDSTINTLTNENTIEGISGMYIRSNSHIQTLINKGTIKATSNGTSYAGIVIHTNSTIDTLINKGTIQSETFGVSIAGGKFGKLIMEDGAVVHGKRSGITVAPNQTLGDLEISGANTKISGNETGILLDKNATTQKIDIKDGAAIQGGLAGIQIQRGSLSGDVNISGGAKIQGGKNAGITNFNGKITGNITIKDGATITSTSKRAIENTGSGSISGGITISGANTTLEGNIVNTGNSNIGSTIKIERGASVNGGLVNNGNASISGSISIDENSKLNSITNTSTSENAITGSIETKSKSPLAISNSGNIKGNIIAAGEGALNLTNSGSGNIAGGVNASGSAKVNITNDGGTINKGITLSGDAQLDISNTGVIGKNDKGDSITNNSSKGVLIKNWNLGNKNGKLDTLAIGGSNTQGVKIDKLTINQGGLDLSQLGDINNLVAGIPHQNIGSITTNGAGDLTLSYDPLSGKLSTDVDLNSGIAGASYRNLMNNSIRRSSFIDSVVSNSMNSLDNMFNNGSAFIVSSFEDKDAYYADLSSLISSDILFTSKEEAKKHSVFLLPYHSYQKTELSLGEYSKGNIDGIITGYSTKIDKSLYGVYVGYEKTAMQSSYFDINNKAYYTGLKYFNNFYNLGDYQEFYLKVDSKLALIQNDLTKKIGDNLAKANPRTYGYALGGTLGVNFAQGENVFSPELSVAYEGSYTQSYSMENTQGAATVRGGERYYANKLNLFSTKLSLGWYRDWHPHFKTLVQGGMKFNLNPVTTSSARFGKFYVSDSYLLPRFSEFGGASLIVPVSNAFYFSINYNGNFDKNGAMHTGYAQFNYLW
ncbi:hypothetical protein, partial [Helicobacter mesocricetorum]|uniref:hypothetical protein n=1 Tax=Helicobacter mesocricetorum TaxID=87012 RepID=UPI002D7767CA